MDQIKKLAERMRSDWDRRIGHDYRFWMSDGCDSDEAMWESGQRDFDLLLGDLSGTEEQVFLELGCGVGRLLKPALAKFKTVIGVDVSEQAIEKAKELLGHNANLDLQVGNGFDLSGLSTQSVDVAISFAALCSIPTEVIANYLLELNRVLKPGSELRLQVYLGNEQKVDQQDTLFIRCFTQSNFENALEQAGFKLESSRELVLPFQVSIENAGVMAMLVTAKKTSEAKVSSEELSRILLPKGEVNDGSAWTGSPLEYWMSVEYAKRLIENGECEKAEKALDHAVSSVENTTSEVEQLYLRLQQVNKKDSLNNSASIFDLNFKVLKQRYPDLAEKVLSTDCHAARELEVNQTEEGPVLIFKGQCLDHPRKPRAGAKAWVDRLCREERFSNSDHIVVFGMGSGYHLEALVGRTKKVSLIEPSLETFRAALETRDLSELLSNLGEISLGTDVPYDLLEQGGELAVRPQTQSGAAEFCNFVRSASYSKRGFNSLKPSIAVLGPLQGGTLPITGYVARALSALGQRCRTFDVSGFAPGYHLLNSFVKQKPRQSILQSNFVEMLSQTVLEAVAENPIDILICMAQAPISSRALSELRKQGVITVLWFVEDYLRFDYWREFAKYYDFVFTIQKDDCISSIKAAGAGEVQYLPVACDPGVHSVVDLSAEEKQRWGSPISFVGAGYYNRQQTFAAFSDLPFKIWGTEWPGCCPFDIMVQEGGRRLTPEEYIKIFNSSDININLHSSAERDDVDPFGDFINPRTFELAACGAFQLVDERSLLAEMFTPGEEVITFSNKTDLRDKINYYLERPAEREVVVEKARKKVLAKHTYVQRMEEMLSQVFSSKFEHLLNRQQHSSWGRMLRRAKKHPELEKRCEDAFRRGEPPLLDGLVNDIVNGQGKLSETEQKLMFLHHITSQIIHMRKEGEGG